jgi:hypothetical protein
MTGREVSTYQNFGLPSSMQSWAWILLLERFWRGGRCRDLSCVAGVSSLSDSPLKMDVVRTSELSSLRSADARSAWPTHGTS